MSTNVNTLTAHDAVGHSGSAPIGADTTGRIRHWLGQWFGARLDAFRRAMALRRTLQEISLLSERELADIGLQQDEIVRLRSSEVFMPRSWQVPRVGRDELPF